MRDSSQSVIIYVMFGVLVFVFAVSFGPGMGSCGGVQTDYAAKVDGDIIRREDFAITYRAQMDYQRRLGAFGAGLDDERLQRELRRQVIDQLIETRLLTHEAERLGMTVTDEELLRYLKERYRVDEVDFDDYEVWVNRNFATSVAKFERNTRGDILAARLGDMVQKTISISDEELKEQYLREHDRAKVRYVRFNPRDVEVPAPTDSAIDALLASEADAVKAHYERDVFQYRTPEQRKVRQILLPLPRDAAPADEATARNRLVELKGQVEGGADFAALAAQVAEETGVGTTDLGAVERGHLARPLDEAVFSLAAGALSDPVRSPQGMHLLQVTEVIPPGRKEYEQVQREVAADLLRERAQREGARARAEAMLAALSRGEDLEALTWSREEEREKTEAAREARRTLTDAKPVRYDSAWILRAEQALPGIGESEALHQAIFAATEEAPLVPEVHEVGRYFFVVQLTERETPDLAKLEEEKEALREQAVWTKRSQVFRAWVAHLRSQARIELNPELFGDESTSS